MTARKDTFVFQKQEKQYREHCCVPECTASSKCNGVLSFHGFPSDAKLRGLWLASIRRDNFRVTSHSKVCSLHFTADQIIQPKTSEGRRKLNKGTVPVLFPWNNYSIQPPTPSICDQVSRPEAVMEPMECNPTLDHDYCCVPELACLDETVDENMKLKYEMGELRKEIQELKMQSAFGLQRFVGSDDDIQFYTGFASYCHFMMFWRLIEPPVHKMIRWSRSKMTEKINESVNALHMRQSLQPIDELFLFQMYLAAGLEERDLANRFSIHPFTVSCIISSWTNYLYTLLGSVCIWIDAEDVKAHLPDDFKDFPDTQVIVDCTELKCQTPSSTVLQSEMLSKSHCTMKGLIGMAPHGAVTFVSSLYQGSISDKELLRRSGLADLLTKDMAIMVDKGFLVSDCVDWKVYCPSFPSQNSQMLAHSGFQRQKIARVSTHVERVIQRVKENKLLDSVIPLPIAGSINEIFTVACLLINYQNKPLVRAWAKKRT